MKEWQGATRYPAKAAEDAVAAPAANDRSSGSARQVTSLPRQPSPGGRTDSFGAAAVSVPAIAKPWTTPVAGVVSPPRRRRAPGRHPG